MEGSFGQGKPHRTLSSQEAEVKKGLDGGIRRTVHAAPELLSILLSWGTGLPPQDILCASSRMLSLPQTSYESKISPYIKEVKLFRLTELFFPLSNRFVNA